MKNFYLAIISVFFINSSVKTMETTIDQQNLNKSSNQSIPEELYTLSFRNNIYKSLLNGDSTKIALLFLSTVTPNLCFYFLETGNFIRANYPADEKKSMHVTYDLFWAENDSCIITIDKEYESKIHAIKFWNVLHGNLINNLAIISQLKPQFCLDQKKQPY